LKEDFTNEVEIDLEGGRRRRGSSKKRGNIGRVRWGELEKDSWWRSLGKKEQKKEDERIKNDSICEIAKDAPAAKTYKEKTNIACLKL